MFGCIVELISEIFLCNITTMKNLIICCYTFTLHSDDVCPFHVESTKLLFPLCPLFRVCVFLTNAVFSSAVDVAADQKAPLQFGYGAIFNNVGKHAGGDRWTLITGHRRVKTFKFFYSLNCEINTLQLRIYCKP